MATPSELTAAAIAAINDLRQYAVIANPQAAPTTEFARSYQQAMAALATAVEAIVSGGGGGGIQGLANIGTGAEILAGTVAGIGQFRTLLAGANIVITPQAQALQISASAPAAGVPLVATIGAVPQANYATINAAITAFAAGGWGDGVTFSVVFLDDTAQSTAWAGLPGTTQSAVLATGLGFGPEITFTAPFPGDLQVRGPIAILVDTTHLCERTDGNSVRLVLADFAAVNAAAAPYDLARSDSSPFIVVTTDASALNCRFFATDTGGTPTTSFVVAYRGFIAGSITEASTGTGAGAETVVQAVGSTINGSNLVLSGSMSDCSVEQTHRSATDRLELYGLFVGCRFILNRSAGGTAFTYTFGGAFGARIEACEFTTGDTGAAAGAMTVLGGVATDLIDTVLPARTASGTLAVGATVARSVVRCSCTSLNTISLAVSKEIDNLVLGNVPGNLTLDAPVLRGLRITATSPVAGLGVGYTIGSSGNRSLVQDLRLNMAGASNYDLVVAGEVFRDITCLDPEPGGGATHVFGSVSGAFPITQMIENLNVRGTRAGTVTATIIAVNLVGFTGRLDLAGQTVVGASLFVVHAQDLVLSGDLVCEFRPQPPAAAPPLQQGVLDSCEVVGTAAISGAGVEVHQISNCLFVGVASLAGTGTTDLQLTNTHFVALPVIGTPAYDRAVVASCISDLATVITAARTEIAASINFLPSSDEVELLPVAGSIALNLLDGDAFVINLDGNYTLENPTNLFHTTALIRVVQGAGGGNTLAFGNLYMFEGGTPPTITAAANAVDLLTLYAAAPNVIVAHMPDLQVQP